MAAPLASVPFAVRYFAICCVRDGGVAADARAARTRDGAAVALLCGPEDLAQLLRLAAASQPV